MSSHPTTPWHATVEQYAPEEIEALREVVARCRDQFGARDMPLVELTVRGHALELAEEDAVCAIGDMMESCQQLLDTILRPGEPHDERRMFTYQGSLSHEYEAVVIALSDLADTRNTHKIQR